MKGSLPLFVVVLSRVFLRQTHSREVYLSLVPIVVGVSLVSFQSPTRNPNLFLGIVFAFASTLNLALLNVFSKQLLSTTFSAISLLHLLTKLSLLIFLPFYLFFSLSHRQELLSWSYITPQLPFVLLLDGALSFRSALLSLSSLMLTSVQSEHPGLFPAVHVLATHLLHRQLLQACRHHLPVFPGLFCPKPDAAVVAGDCNLTGWHLLLQPREA